MTHKQIAQAFAEGKAAEGWPFYCKLTDSGAAVLYSYTTPIAYKTVGSLAFDKRTYSTTTAIQISKAKSVIGEGNYEVVEHENFREQCKLIGADLSLAR